jgi:hypothetical protein
MDRASAIISSAGLRMLKPLANTVVSVLVLMKRENRTGQGMSIAQAETLSGLRLGARLVRVTTALRTNNSKDHLEMIPMIVSQLGFPGRYEKYMRAVLLRCLNSNNTPGNQRRPTRGSLFAVVVYRFFEANREKSQFKDRIDIDYIASITQTTASNIQRCIQCVKF